MGVGNGGWGEYGIIRHFLLEDRVLIALQSESDLITLLPSQVIIGWCFVSRLLYLVLPLSDLP
jgi:hypothetical protein